MGIFDRLIAAFSRRGVEVRVSRARSAVMGMDAAELYRTQPALQAVVTFLADNVAQLPLKVYTRDSDTDRRRDTESDAARALARPNADTTRYELMRDSMLDLFIYGRFLWFVQPEKDAGYQIRRIPADWVVDTMTKDGFAPSKYCIQNPETGGSVEIDASDIVCFRNYSPDGSVKPPMPIDALKECLCEQINAWQYRNSVWRNGGRVSQWISRPLGAPWGEGARERFAESWKNRFAGKDGTDTGGTPLLEDGMRLETTTFNAREAQWVEATKLTREDVAAIYHLNPAHVWHTDGQSYASAKDNARALYADTLGPSLEMVQQRVTQFVLPLMGAAENTYAEFDLQAKLAGSFEEQAGVLQSAVGAPYMLRNEARARMNLPAIEGGDELIVPLNVLEGGLASPNDTDPTVERYNAAPKPAAKNEETPRKARGRVEKRNADEMADVLRSFFKRQRRSVLNAIERSEKADRHAEWYDMDRWTRELAEDLLPVFMSQSASAGRRALRSVDERDFEYDEGITRNYLEAMAQGKARAVNNVTYRQLVAALASDDEDEAMRSTPEGVFDLAEGKRAETTAVSFATACAGFGTMEAAHQLERAGVVKSPLKTWIVTSSNPRSSHAAMNGETVPIDEEFSNGAKWPGDQFLDPEESCNCMCQVEITVF